MTRSLFVNAIYKYLKIPPEFVSTGNERRGVKSSPCVDQVESRHTWLSGPPGSCRGGRVPLLPDDNFMSPGPPFSQSFLAAEEAIYKTRNQRREGVSYRQNTRTKWTFTTFKILHFALDTMAQISSSKQQTPALLYSIASPILMSINSLCWSFLL